MAVDAAALAPAAADAATATTATDMASTSSVNQVNASQLKIANFVAMQKQANATGVKGPRNIQKSQTPVPPSITNVDEGIKPSAGNTESVTDTAKEGLNNFFAGLAVPGGLLAAFIVLVLVIWLLLPTQSGYTRFQLLWLMILKKTSINTGAFGAHQSTTTSGNQGPTKSQLEDVKTINEVENLQQAANDFYVHSDFSFDL